MSIWGPGILTDSHNCLNSWYLNHPLLRMKSPSIQYVTRKCYGLLPYLPSSKAMVCLVNRAKSPKVLSSFITPSQLFDTSISSTQIYGLIWRFHLQTLSVSLSLSISFFLPICKLQSHSTLFTTTVVLYYNYKY